MKKLKPNGVKLLKVFHLLFAIMWICGAIALILGMYIATADTGDELYMKLRMLQVIDDWIIIPGANGCLLTGIIYGIWTNWGFFKYRWLTVKWILTVIQMLFGTFFLGVWLNGSVEIAGSLRDTAFSNSQLIYYTQMISIWGLAQLGLLLLYIVISVYKPWKKKKSISIQATS